MGSRTVVVWLICLLFQACLHPVFAESKISSPLWIITKTEWTQQDEAGFQDFVRQIGDAVESRACSDVTSCMNSAANPFRPTDPPGLTYRSDCADFPYFLRGYYAWKKALPFAFANEMTTRPLPGNESQDLRYSKFGNQVEGRFSVASSNGQLKNALKILNEYIPNTTSTANYRTHYSDSNTDFYPVRISSESIRIGTTLYDPNGHVALIYKISKDGKAYYIDAHPDNSVSAGVFSAKYMRSHPGQGAGFKNWRPLKLIGATLSSDGTYIGGRIVLASNDELADYSVEQYFGTQKSKLPDDQWSKGRFYSSKGEDIGFYEYVRIQLAMAGYRTYPIAELKSIVAEICGTLKDRVQAVEIAIQDGIDRKPHPERLPKNIYGAEGEWENYSTPSRDAQLKFSFSDMLSQVADYLRRWKSQDANLEYAGKNLAEDLLNTYANEAMKCRITYTNSAQVQVTLNLEEVRQRLFQLSFDPYHCVERRWGALNAVELHSCQDDSHKTLWYQREQRMRNQMLRQFEHRMDFTLEELLQPFPGNGTDDVPNVDILGFLKSKI